jgi:hypothetical protein
MDRPRDVPPELTFDIHIEIRTYDSFYHNVGNVEVCIHNRLVVPSFADSSGGVLYTMTMSHAVTDLGLGPKTTKFFRFAVII